MGKLFTQLQKALRPGMVVPDPIQELFAWIEKRKFYSDEKDGTRVGTLNGGRLMGPYGKIGEAPTHIEFAPVESDVLISWFGTDSKKHLDRICVFATTGGDGSMAAFWLDERGQQHIVHMGSGSGSSLACILASDAVDFLRLLAIGYFEICWDHTFDAPREHDENEAPPAAGPDRFQKWVMATFNVQIPECAVEIVQFPDSMDDEKPRDKFAKWLVRSRDSA